MKHDLITPKKEAILMFMGLLETRVITTHNPINIDTIETSMRRPTFRSLLREVLASTSWVTHE